MLLESRKLGCIKSRGSVKESILFFRQGCGTKYRLFHTYSKIESYLAKLDGPKKFWWFLFGIRIFGFEKFHIDNKSLVEFFQLVLFLGCQSKPQRGLWQLLRKIFSSSQLMKKLLRKHVLTSLVSPLSLQRNCCKM